MTWSLFCKVGANSVGNTACLPCGFEFCKYYNWTIQLASINRRRVDFSEIIWQNQQKAVLLSVEYKLRPVVSGLNTLLIYI